jgi:hypothetical protein
MDRVTWVFLGCVALSGIVYTALELTPSSYGAVLVQIGVPDDGPLLGTARFIRSDEWAFSTSALQAAVRNGFRRTNETSFYREDLRAASIPLGLPLKDWSLVFKPELWLFFVVSPALAFSAYYALMMCGSLAGYQLLLRRIGVDPFVAAAVSVMILFSGFAQFWWTTFAPLIAGFPWILLILFSALRGWTKALLLGWAMPAWALADFYPVLLVQLAFAAVVMVFAMRPKAWRDKSELIAAAAGGLAMLLVLYAYYADVIPAMRNTVYPGHRIAAPGTATASAVWSQFWPSISFSLAGYQNFVGQNICEIAAVGSFLPILTICLTRFDALQSDAPARRALTILLAALALATCWEIADAPRWIGRLLLWDLGPAQRLLLASGLLITLASLVIWRSQLITVHPARILIFAVVGPVVSVALKRSLSTADFVLGGFILAAALIACFVPATFRSVVLLSAIAFANVYAFGRFNPLQPAGPIFATPDTELVRQLRVAQDSAPEHFLADGRFLGGTLNGMGFRSVSHALPSPPLAVMRRYFPAMEAARFNAVFNRCCYIQVTDDRVPNTPLANIVNVPAAAFAEARNLRQLRIEAAPRKDCSTQRGGAVDRVTAKGDRLVIEGWAPWQGEVSSQELRVASTRPLEASPLVTIMRPDVAEKLRDYRYARAGFRLEIAAADRRPIEAGEVVLVGRNTSQGLAQLSGCGCP